MTLFINARSDSSRTYICYPPVSSSSPTPSSRSDAPSRSLSSTSQRRSPVVHTPTSKVPTSTSPLTSPTPCEDEIVEKILNHSMVDGSQHIQIPGVDEAMYDQIKTHTDTISERLRYYYDCNSCSIIINMLPSHIHESLQEYLTDSFKYSLRRWVTTLVAQA